MFHSARIKLTVWYLLIIMVITMAFSLVVYRVSVSELNRLERAVRTRSERQFDRVLFPPPPFIAPELIEETRQRIVLLLGLIDLGILGTSAVAGYFLASRTLRPIQEMVDEQGRFISDASHELRTPLTSLKTATEVYLRGKKHTLRDADELISSNLDEVNSLQSLSDNLIKLTQFGRNGNALLETVTVAAISEEAVKKVAGLAKSKHIQIVNQTGGEKLRGHEQSLTELIVILLDNAIKYSPKNTAVTLSSKSMDHSVEINVSDQGVGISSQDLPHVFDRFYRGDKSRQKTNIPGYGLGLAIASQIITKHHGTILTQSQPGKETTFIINLPR